MRRPGAAKRAPGVGLLLFVLLFVLPQCTKSPLPSQEPHESRETVDTERMTLREDASVEPGTFEARAEALDAAESTEQALEEPKEGEHDVVQEEHPQQEEPTENAPDGKCSGARREACGCVAQTEPCLFYQHPYENVYNRIWKTYFSIEGLVFHPEGLLLHLMQRSSIGLLPTAVFVEWDGKVRFETEKDKQRARTYPFKALRNHMILVPKSNSFLDFFITRDDLRPDTIYWTIRWYSLRDGSYMLGGEGGFAAGLPGSWAKPAYDPNKNLVLVPSANELVAYRLDQALKNTGNPIWRAKFDADVACSISVGKDSRIYTCLGDGHFVALDSTGKELWKYKAFRSFSSPSRSSIIPTTTDIFFLVSGHFVPMNPQGKPKFSKLFRMTSPAVYSPTKEFWFDASAQLRAYSEAGVRLQDLRLGEKFAPPLVFEDSSILYYDLHNYRVVHYSSKGKLLQSFDVKFRLSNPEVQRLYAWKGAVYLLVDRLGVSIMRLPMKVPPVAKTGWPTLHGNLQNHRQQQ